MSSHNKGKSKSNSADADFKRFRDLAPPSCSDEKLKELISFHAGNISGMEVAISNLWSDEAPAPEDWQSTGKKKVAAVPSAPSSSERISSSKGRGRSLPPGRGSTGGRGEGAIGRSSSNNGRGPTRSASLRPVSTPVVTPSSSFTDDEKPSVVPVSSSTFAWGQPKEIEKPKEEIIVVDKVDVIKKEIKIIEKVEEPIVAKELEEKVAKISKQTGSAWNKGPTLAEKLIIQEEVKKNPPQPVVIPVVVEETPVVEQATDKKMRKSRGKGGAGNRKVSDDIVVPTEIDTIASVVDKIAIQEEVKIQKEVLVTPSVEKNVEVIQEPIFVAETVVPVVNVVQSPNSANIIQEKLNPSIPKPSLKLGRWAGTEETADGDGLMFGSFSNYVNDEQPSGSSAWGVTQSNDNQHSSESTWANGTTVESSSKSNVSISLSDIKSISAPSNQNSYGNKSAGPPPGLEGPSHNKQNQQQNRGAPGQRSNKHDQSNFQQQQYQYNNAQIGGQMQAGRSNIQQPNMVYGNTYPPGLDQSYIPQQPNNANAYPSVQTTSMHTSPTTTAPIVAGSGPTATNANTPVIPPQHQQQQQYPPGMQSPYGYYPQQNPYYQNTPYYYQSQVPQNFGYNQGGRGGYQHQRPYGSDPYNTGQSLYLDQGYGQGGFGMDGMPMGTNPQVGSVGNTGKQAKGNGPTGAQTGSTGSHISQDVQHNTQNNYGYGYNARGDQQQSWQYPQNPSQGNWQNPMMGFPISNSPIGGGQAPFSQQPGGGQQGNQNTNQVRGNEQQRGNTGGNNYNPSSFNNQRNGSQQQANNNFYYSGGATTNP